MICTECGRERAATYHSPALGKRSVCADCIRERHPGATLVGPDPDRLADAERRAAQTAEHLPQRSNRDASRILAFDVLAEFVDDIYEGEDGQVVWALLWAKGMTDLAAHEARLLEDARKKIDD